MSIRAGVIVAVTLQQVDRAPDAKTGTERHDESLQYANCTVEKCHTGLLNGSPAGVELVMPDLSVHCHTPRLFRLYRQWVRLAFIQTTSGPETDPGRYVSATRRLP